MDGKIYDKYKYAMKSILKKLLPELEEFEIEEGLDYSIGKKYKEIPIKVHNNNNNKYLETTLENLTNQLLSNKAIMTTQGVLFMKHGESKNIFYNFIDYLLQKRVDAKEEMKKYKKGTEEYNKYNLMQANYKVACNALYGCAGAPSSIFYNLYLCTAVTSQGRGAISASITMFESFLSNNIKFASLTEVLTFIDNICKDIEKETKFNDYNVLDRDITTDECFIKVLKSCGYNNWVPTDKAVQIIWNTINNLSQKQINVLYYKNNLYEFCNNQRVSNLILNILTKLETPFLNPYKPPEEIKSDLEMLYDLMFEYVYYRHIYIDKLDRIYNMVRDVILLTDTDSCVVSLNGWYKFVLNKTIGIPMKIKYTKAEIKDVAEKIVLEFQKTEITNEYDFYNDRLVDKKRLEYPAVIIEEDNLRYSIINIISYILSQLILDYMDLLTDNYNASGDKVPRLMIMKNEFLFKSILLTEAKKNYASLQLLQEGNIIPDNKQFDIKGLPIHKIGLSKSTAEQLSNLLEFDILRRSFVDQVELIKKFAILEKKIYESVRNGDKEYHKIARIKSAGFYDNPLRQQGIKASMAYNSIKGKDEEGINLEERNTIMIIKTIINKKNAKKIMDEFPDHYLRLMKLLEQKEFSEITAVAIPTNCSIPKWLIPFIDYTTIIHDNLRNFPLEAIGISKLDSKDITHSNILRL